MPRNFGLRESGHRFWNEPTDPRAEERWAFAVIGAAVVLVVLVGIFV